MMLKPRQFNGFLYQCIIQKFGSERKFADVLGINFTRISHVINYHFFLNDADKEHWAAILGQPVDKLFCDPPKVIFR